MKFIHWVWDNILFLATLFLLAFIPLFPKRPLLDVINTWVYIRAEDFVVVVALLIWVLLLLKRKITLRTPLTVPIFIFWIVGAIATIHGVLLIFPIIGNVFPNVAFLSFLRRIEYLSLFFVAFSGLKDKRLLPYVIATLVVTLLLVVGYGFGQKYAGFPAYLTMNEEFAKGEAIQLSQLSRVPSTFGGHYDLAAYLVLIIPILTSLIFGFRKWLIKGVIIGIIGLGFVLLFMTVSRVSFFVVLISLSLVFLFQRRGAIMLFLPVVVIGLVLLFLGFAPTLSERFGNTIAQVDVLIDAKTGAAIGHPKEVDSSYFKDKIIMQKAVHTKSDLDSAIANPEEDPQLASPSALLTVPFELLPSPVILVTAVNISTGENLPQGTGYINLSLSPVIKKVGQFFYERPPSSATQSAQILVFYGDFLIKRAAAYDLSFTTRFQGEWPNALSAFKRNIFIGSGYSSVSLAVDNNYLRILGEVGLLGFASFVAIFVTIGIYIRKVLPEVDSKMARSFVLGFAAGTIGLGLNALLIDVFEASKVAFLLWLLTGVTIGLLHLYQTKHIDFVKELRNVFTSKPAIITYICVLGLVVFSPMIGNFFVGDDFTWFRWVTDCAENGSNCMLSFFTQSDGFFYRPGAKIYFSFMHALFWLNQTAYHVVSLTLHIIIAALVFLLAKKIFRDVLFSSFAALLFLILSGYHEAVFWISATGFLFTSMFALLSLLLFIAYDEQKKRVYLAACFVALIAGLLFHELGVVTPFLFILYSIVRAERFQLKELFNTFYYFFIPIVLYLVLRFLAGSHWFSGDYNYNLLKFPFNAIGNALGYFFLTLLGPMSLPFYETLRNATRENIFIALLVILPVIYILFLVYRMTIGRIEQKERRIIIFGFGFFVIGLLPFLGLGNIASRYSYLASIGLVFIFAFLAKKLYLYLQSYGRDIALTATCAIVALFCLLHVIELQQIHSNWYEAGKKVERFFVAIDSLYADNWASEAMDFYFVGVPIREGEAWVFPVGLPDALWLVFRNPDIRVYQSGSVERALSIVDGSENQKVFEFVSDGKIVEHKKILNVR